MSTKIDKYLPTQDAVPFIPSNIASHYQPASIQVNTEGEDKKDNELLQSLVSFAQVGSTIYLDQKQRQLQKAEDKSNEIIRKLTPEQRRQALNDGVLLYQDDPYAMQSLRYKTGKNSAFTVDNEIQEKINNGEFKTREDLEKYKYKHRELAAKMAAEQSGIHINDPDYQKGINEDIVLRNIELYKTHDVFLNNQSINESKLQASIELNTVLDDSGNLSDGNKSATFFTKYLENGLQTGSIASDREQENLIRATMLNVTQRVGSINFLKSLESKKIKHYGKDITVKQIYGDEAWNNLLIKAQETQFTHNYKLQEELQLNINSALYQPDVQIGWEKLNIIEQQLNLEQPSTLLTSQKASLINAKVHLQNRLKQDSTHRLEQLAVKIQDQNKQQVIEEQFKKRINNQPVSTKFSDLPVNERTGEFSHSDMIKYANNKLIEIDNMKIPNSQKNDLRIKYLQADAENGGFRVSVQQLVDSAEQEWLGATISGQLPDKTPAINMLKALYNTNPQVIAGLYPKQSTLITKLNILDKYRINPQVLLAADRNKDTPSSTLTSKNNLEYLQDKYPNLSSEVTELYKDFHNSLINISGGAELARESTEKLINQHTYTFTGFLKKGWFTDTYDTIGTVSKRNLQVTSDPDSWKIGKSIIQEALKQLRKKNTYLETTPLMISEVNNIIYIRDTSGNLSYKFDQKSLYKSYSDSNKKQQQDKIDQAINNLRRKKSEQK